MPDATLPVITPRGAKIEPSAGAPFEAVRVARDVLHTSRTAGLATIDPESSYPYNTATNVALEPDGTPFFFAARLALHARNIEADPRISLVLAPFNKGDALTLPRLTLVGEAVLIDDTEVPLAKARYVARYPKAKLYLSLPDTQLYRMKTEGVQINGGPARNASNITPADLRTDFSGAEELMAASENEAARLNAIRGEASRLAVLAGKKSAAWKITAIDPDGINLASANDLARLWFEERVTDMNQLAKALQQPSK
ncbi:pyridoxamine 5'-phosphate oxidase family protein [Agrobacterium tumefaciens]|uniref:HugZ family pyridoxamine 5'-phosphate oxidase n=1 Tax=Agrobacterium tumefaciens TaxID=358 RepID=UPI00287EA2DB|nr:pyridoxamine 5'-phosphate oxidase family protein [Agrobacterium tumefaciens]MDS7597564.1 pyridoxamine 5'-phosphate oxidase family protein [Agrobacterium tumefaciens]